MGTAAGSIDTAAIRARGNRDAVTWVEIAGLCDALDAARAEIEDWRDSDTYGRVPSAWRRLAAEYDVMEARATKSEAERDELQERDAQVRALCERDDMFPVSQVARIRAILDRAMDVDR